MKISPSLYLVGDTDMGITDGGDCHIYMVKGRSGLFLIDAGGSFDSGRSLVRSIESEGFNTGDITHFLLTHHHRDHACGAKFLKELSGCEVWINAQSGKHLLEEGTDEELGIHFAKKHGMYALDYQYIHCKVDHAIEDGEEFIIAGVDIKAYTVTGHSCDSMCFVMNLDGVKCLFSGDVFFFGGLIGVLNYPMSSIEGYHADMPKLVGLGIDALLPGHGLFCMKNGQSHVDKVMKNLDSIIMPFNFGQVPYPGF